MVEDEGTYIVVGVEGESHIIEGYERSDIMVGDEGSNTKVYCRRDLLTKINTSTRCIIET